MAPDIGVLAPGKRESRPTELSGFQSCQIGTDSDQDNSSTFGQQPECDAFYCHRDAALALLNEAEGLSRQAGSFLGQLVVDPTPMSVKQAAWLDKLLERSALPPFVGGCHAEH